MRKLYCKQRIGLGVLAMGAALSVDAADIYRSQDSDGTERFASQPLDTSYVLYLKGDDPPVVAAPARANPILTAPQSRAALETLADQLAQKHAVAPALVRAVIEVESRFNSRARSSKGATGAMQLMPATAARYGVTRHNDPAQNIEAGIRFLKDLLVLHDGHVALALASYNAGAGAVAKHGRRIPPYRETMLYVPAVLAKLQATRMAIAP